MSNNINDTFLDAFQSGDVERAQAWVNELPSHGGVEAHPLLREFVRGNHGHCYKAGHMRIAEMLIPDEVRAFRDAVLDDRVDEVARTIAAEPESDQR